MIIKVEGYHPAEIPDDQDGRFLSCERCGAVVSYLDTNTHDNFHSLWNAQVVPIP